MTTRLKGFIVVLDDDMREDDAEGILSAIRHVKGVCSVTPVTKNMEDTFARQRVRREMEDAIWKALKGDS